MNREIKFRIWDIENKEMLKVQELDFEPTFYGGKIAIRPDKYNDYFDTEDMILMQYTGLHDKNGKEIYEGDIVKVTYKNETEIFEVRYDEENTCFRMYYKDLKFLDFAIEEVDLYEVIGNIYDNPELLGGE